MEFWPEFLASSGGHEFVAGGVGGMAGVLAGHPLDTLRIRLQQPPPPVSPGITAARLGRPPSAVAVLRGILRAEGPSALYRGMAAPLGSVAFQHALAFLSSCKPAVAYWFLRCSRRYMKQCNGLPSLRDPIAVARPTDVHLRASLLHERGARRRRHRSIADADLVPRRAHQDPAATRSYGAEAPGPGGHGPGHRPEGGPPRHIPGARGDRAPGRAVARRLLLDVRVRAGAAPPGLPPHGAGEPRDDARVRRPRRRRQLGVLLPAGRGEVAAAGADARAPEVPRRRRLLPEERPGGRVPRAVARPRHGRRAGLRRQRRHLLGLRAGPAVLGPQQRAYDAGHGGELNCRDYGCDSIHLQDWSCSRRQACARVGVLYIG